MKIFTCRWKSGYVITLFISDNWYIQHTKNYSKLSPVKDYSSFIKSLETIESFLATTKWWRMKNKQLIENAYKILQDVEKNGPGAYKNQRPFYDFYEVSGL